MTPSFDWTAWRLVGGAQPWRPWDGGLMHTCHRGTLGVPAAQTLDNLEVTRWRQRAKCVPPGTLFVTLGTAGAVHGRRSKPPRVAPARPTGVHDRSDSA